MMKDLYSVDYDRVAAEYDGRYQEGSNQGVRDLLHHTRSQVVGPALEVGCGTGHWLPYLASGVAEGALGLDRSLGMLRRAREKDASVRLCQGDAVRLPFAQDTMALTASVNALHHFSDPTTFLGEAGRVLQPGGQLLIVGLDAHDPDAEWYVYDHFYGVQRRDRDRYPAWDWLRERCRAVGMEITGSGVAHEIRQVLRGREVFDDPFLDRNGSSQLALLSDRAYERGVAHIRRSIERAEAGGGTAQFRVRLDLVYLLARTENRS